MRLIVYMEYRNFWRRRGGRGQPLYDFKTFWDRAVFPATELGYWCD
jgi:hypothetical protein